MLILTRKIGETLVIDGNIEVTILGIKGGQIRIGITAPKEIQIHRLEVYKRIQEALAQSKQTNDDEV